MEQQQILLNELSKEEKVAFLALIKHIMAHYEYGDPICISISPGFVIGAPVVMLPPKHILPQKIRMLLNAKNIKNIKNRYCRKMGIEDSFFAKKYSSMDEILDKFSSEKSRKIVLVEMIRFLNQRIFELAGYGYGYCSPTNVIISEVVTKFDSKDFIGELIKNPEVAKEFRFKLDNPNMYFYAMRFTV